MKLKRMIETMAALTLAAPGLALATTGYFAHGYGIKAKGMGGVGIALPQDAVAAGTNPAGMAFIGNRVDLGIDWFRPTRETEITGSQIPGFNGKYDGNETHDFFVPEFGYNRMVSPDMAIGVSVFANGGMNTHYNTNPYGALGGRGDAGVDLSQLFISPTLAIKLTPDHAVGISLNLAYQRFKAFGLQPFAGFSANPREVTNKGYDNSIGWGARVGWTGNITPGITLGATYQTKTRMSKFDRYKGLFAEKGDLDIPENYGVGIAIKATPALTVAADVQQINYSEIKSVGNKADCLLVTSTCQLGSSNGAGFGWRDVTVYKLGLQYAVSPALTLRAGYATLRQPIPKSQTLFNILAPAVVEGHATLGATWAMSPTTELSIAYMHAFTKKVKGSGSIPAAMGGGEANLRMYEDSLGIAFAWKL